MMTTFKDWLKAAGVRAVKTIAQTAVATIGTCAALQDVDWVLVVSASVLAGLLSLLTSVAGLPELKLKETLEFESHEVQEMPIGCDLTVVQEEDDVNE